MTVRGFQHPAGKHNHDRHGLANKEKVDCVCTALQWIMLMFESWSAQIEDYYSGGPFVRLWVIIFVLCPLFRCLFASTCSISAPSGATPAPTHTHTPKAREDPSGLGSVTPVFGSASCLVPLTGCNKVCPHTHKSYELFVFCTIGDKYACSVYICQHRDDKLKRSIRSSA